MKKISSENFLSCYRIQIRYMLAILSVSFQVTGIFIQDKTIAGMDFGSSIMIAGFISGFTLLFYTRSIKDALLHLLFFVGPLPLMTLSTIFSTILISAIHNPTNLTDKLLAFKSIAVGIIFIFATISWPYIIGPLTIKAIKNSKLYK